MKNDHTLPTIIIAFLVAIIIGIIIGWQLTTSQYMTQIKSRDSLIHLYRASAEHNLQKCSLSLGTSGAR
jgi:hypothetical protein